MVMVDADTDQCAIVEILLHQAEVLDADAGAFFFDNLATDNGASDGAEVTTCATLSLPEQLPALAASCPPGMVCDGCCYRLCLAVCSDTRDCTDAGHAASVCSHCCVVCGRGDAVARSLSLSLSPLRFTA